MNRIAGVMLIGILCLSMFLAFEPEGNAQSVDWWSMFMHDATHSGYSTSTGPTTAQIAWSYTTGGAVSSSPAVANNIAM